MSLKAKSTRLPWLVAILLGLLNVLLWQRQSIAGWISQFAIDRSEQAGATTTRKYLDLASMISRHAPQTQLALARLQRRQGNLIESHRHLQRAMHLGIDPQRAERERILALAQSGQMRLASPHLPHLLETAAGDEAEVCEAFTLGYLRMRDFRSALILLGAWAEERPRDARPHAWVGQIQSELKATTEAEAAFGKALQLDPRNASAAYGMGQLLLDNKRPTEAIEFFQLAVDDPIVGPAAAAGLAGSLMGQRRVAEAAQVLEAALRRFGDDYRLVVEKANMFLEQGEYAQAETLLRPHANTGNARREVRYAYAIALRGLGRVDEATAHFTWAASAAERAAAANRKIADISADPSNAQLRYEIGEAHLSSGNIEDGLLWLQSALEVDAGHRATHRALANYYETRTPEHPRFISLVQRHRSLAGPDSSIAEPGGSVELSGSEVPLKSGE